MLLLFTPAFHGYRSISGNRFGRLRWRLWILLALTWAIPGGIALVGQGGSGRLGDGTPDASVRFRQLTIADGLPQNAVHAILQDRRGFMWFGTKDGLSRYDGYSFLVHRHDAFDSTSISGNHVTALFEDSRGVLWAGTQEGVLNRFDRDREAFRRYPASPSYGITSIGEDGEGGLWIGTEGAGLVRLPIEEIDKPEPRFEQFVHDPENPRSLSNDEVYTILIDARGVLWAGTENGLNRMDEPGRSDTGFVRYTRHPTAPDGLLDDQVWALHEDRAGQLWIGAISGLSLLDVGRQRITHYPHRYQTFRYGWGQAVQVLEDRNGDIWMSTKSELMRFDPKREVYTYFRYDPLNPTGINSDLPTALHQDRSGLLWVGTNGYGINIHDPRANRFGLFRRPEGRTYRYSGFSIYSLFEDSSGLVWIGAGVLYRWNRETGAFTSYETDSNRPNDFGNTGVWSILEDPPGYLWAGTFQGLYHYEIETGRARQYVHDPDDSEGLPEREVYGVHKAPDGSIWVVTENYLSKMIDGSAGRFTRFRVKERPTEGTWTFPSTHQDAQGVFWLASNDGLIRFDPRTQALRTFRSDSRQPESLSHNVVRSICPDPSKPDTYLWIGTAGGGLNRFNTKTETFQHFREKDGLPNSVVYGILADEAGSLWMSTNKGLSRFDPVTLRFRNFDENDGLQSNEFNSGAYFKSTRGELFFGGIHGFNYFVPDEIEDNPNVPEIVITGFKRLNRYESVRDSATVLRKAVSETDTLRLSYRDNVVTFEFAALDFAAPSKNRYAYRMEGYNESWIEAGSIRSATYTNLPPGTYTFRVKGSNNDGVWNEEGTSLTVVVAPPWWRTWWAYLVYGVLILVVLVGMRRYEMGRIRLKNLMEIERVEAEKLRELDRSKSRFFANVSHEFRTPLTLTLGPLEDLRSGLYGTMSPEMTEQVDLARRNAGRVLDLINQILDVARLESGRTPLRARRLDLGRFVKDLSQTFVPLAERKAMSFHVKVPAGPLVVYADSEHLEKALANLLSNALKFTPDGGTVRVTADRTGDTARVTVRDSGPGIPAEDLPLLFDRFHRVNESSTLAQPGTGIGLALAKELVDLHGGKLSAESEVGFGSTFTLTLRLGRAHLTPQQIVEDDAVEPWMPHPAAVLAHEDAAGPAEEVAPAWVDEDVTTVLVVEDNAEVRAYIRRHLQSAYRVVEAADGEEGLLKARANPPDLVLSDVMMPGMDGYALCRALKSDPETDFVPVVLLTAKATPEDRLEGLQGLADDYLTKPFDVSELKARIGNLISLRRRLRERYGNEGKGTVAGRSEPSLALHPVAVDVSSTDAQFLERVRGVIDAHLGDDTFSVEGLAQAVGVSRGHLHRQLTSLLNQPPSDVIRTMRLERAAQLLEARAGTVSEIAYAVGFKSVAHFSNAFDRQYGCRPTAFQVQGHKHG